MSARGLRFLGLLLGFVLGPAELLAAQPETAQPAQGRRYALLVGVQHYTGTGLGNLKYCENDVSRLADVLRGLGYNRVVLLTRTEAQKNLDRDDILPTAENIRDHLKAILRERKANDTVLVAFAGHGVQLARDKRMYFCPSKCKLDNPPSLIALDDIYAQLKECRAGTRILLADACRNDPLDGRGGNDGRLQSLSRPQLPDPPGGAVALFSCSRTQTAHESPKLKHGYLFHFVIEGLKGKAAHPRTGLIVWERLVLYVKEELSDQVKDEYGPRAEQTPESRGTARNIVLARVSTPSPPPRKPSDGDGPPPQPIPPPNLKPKEETREFRVLCNGGVAGSAQVKYQTMKDGVKKVSCDVKVGERTFNVFQSGKAIPVTEWLLGAYSYSGDEQWKDGRLLSFQSDVKRQTFSRVTGAIFNGTFRVRLDDGIPQLIREVVWPTSHWFQPGKVYHLVDPTDGKSLGSPRVSQGGRRTKTILGCQQEVWHSRIGLTEATAVDLWYDDEGRLVHREWAVGKQKYVMELTRIRP